MHSNIHVCKEFSFANNNVGLASWKTPALARIISRQRTAQLLKVDTSTKNVQQKTDFSMICSRKVIRNRDPTRLYSQLSLAMKKAEFDSVSHEKKEKKKQVAPQFSPFLK